MKGYKIKNAIISFLLSLFFYYIAKKLESGKTTGSVKEAISQSDIDKPVSYTHLRAQDTMVDRV